MDMATVQLKHANAEKLLKDLEEMDIIKIVEPSIKNDASVKPFQIRGFLSKEQANTLLSHVVSTRKEWDERFPAE